MSLELLKEGLRLRMAEAVREADFVCEESERVLYERLSRPLVCLRTEKVQIKPGALGGCFGEDAPCGRYGEVTLGVDLFCPDKTGPSGCGLLFDQLCDFLLRRGEICEIRRGRTEYLTKRGCYQLEAGLLLEVYLAGEFSEEDGAFTGFTLSGELASPFSARKGEI